MDVLSGEHKTDFGRKFNMKPISMQIKRKMVAEVGVTALYLYEYYVQCISQVRDKPITDDESARALGLSEQIVKRNRLKLTSANYYYLSKTSNKRDTHWHYFLGREAVMRAKYYSDLFGVGTAKKVRSKFNPSTALNLIETSGLDQSIQMDLFDTLVPKTADDRKYSSIEWLDY